MNLMLFPASCGTDEAMIKPLQTIADEVSDEVPAHVDIIGVSTALSGETLAVVFHLRDVPENSRIQQGRRRRKNVRVRLGSVD